MIPNGFRAKGGAPQLGARGPGQSGPFGPYLDDALDEGDEGFGESETLSDGKGHARTVTPDGPAPEVVSLTTSPADDRVRQQIAEARSRRERRREQRRQLAERRKHGVAKRHARKLRYLDQRDRPDNPPPTAA